jgi:NAD dependent epimerase/dehydratase
MNWQAKRVLVTGAGGFIGSHLCEALLSEGAHVTAMLRYSSRSDWGNLELLSADARQQLKVIAGNVEDGDFVAQQVKGQDVIFHLAALIAIPYSYVAPMSYVRTNVEGTLNLLEAARKQGLERFIHTSTSEVYGTALYTPIDEKHPLQGQSPYSASKIGADKIAESYYRTYELPVVTVRPFNTFGPRQSARAIIPTIIGQALAETEIKLGSLAPIRDLSFVRDVTQGFIKLAESERVVGETINLGSGEGISIGELARQTLEMMGCKKRIVSDEQRVRPRNSEVDLLICDNSKARQLAGWKPTYSLKQGLQEVLDFISRNLHHYKTDRFLF